MVGGNGLRVIDRVKYVYAGMTEWRGRVDVGIYSGRRTLGRGAEKLKMLK